jgi:glucose-6-phosphate 1-dehydrogenase
MDFVYDRLSDVKTGDPYARLIEDCLLDDPTLFTRADAVEASWRYFDAILDYWKRHLETPLYGYPAGTWGPLESNSLIESIEGSWTNPCKNLIHTDEYCEL